MNAEEILKFLSQNSFRSQVGIDRQSGTKWKLFVNPIDLVDETEPVEKAITRSIEDLDDVKE